MSTRLKFDQALLANFCARHRIRRLSLFGSQLKGTARPDSDVDLLVEFEPEARPSYLDLAGMEVELSTQLGGLRVDLRTAGELSRYFLPTATLLDRHTSFDRNLCLGCRDFLR